MAFPRSTNNDKTSYENTRCDGDAIELSPGVSGNIYDSLENRNRDSHAYSTTGETVAATKAGAKNENSKTKLEDTAKRVAFSIRLCQVAVVLLLVSMFSCTITGLVVHQVLNARITDVESNMLQNHVVMKENQNTSELALKAAIDQRLRIIDIALQTVLEKQNTSEMASIDYHAMIERRLTTLDDAVGSVQKKQNMSGQQVAFTATGTKGTVINGALTFTSVTLNIGNSYDKTTGKFTCPVAGTYLFSATLLSVVIRSSWMQCNIRKNRYNVAVVYSNEGPHDSASISVLFHLVVGDVVDLGSCYGTKDLYGSRGHTSFIGSLIQED